LACGQVYLFIFSSSFLRDMRLVKK